MKNRKTIALLLAMLLTLPALASCGKTETAETDAETETEAAITETETEDTSLKSSLPADLDLAGASVTIHARGDDDTWMEIQTDEATGEALNDAIFNRNLTVEEQLNVDIIGYRGQSWTTYWDSTSDINMFKTSIAAGDNAFQCIAGWNTFIVPLALENYFHDLYDAPYLDLEKPWWNKSASETLTMGGKRHFVTGDISILSMLGGAYVMFANDKIAEDNGISSLADMVRDGSWTIDNMKAITQTLNKDLDGNGVMDKNDSYGFITDDYNAADSWYTSSDIHQIVLDENGIPAFVSQQEKVSGLIDKIYAFWYNGDTAGSYYTNADEQCEMFMNGQALLIQRELDNARTYFRDMEDSYTLLPFPKYDEQQADYITAAYNGATLWCIPVDNPDVDTACAVMEALAYETFTHVTPVYFETCLQTKAARNEDTIEMLDIIRNGCCLDVEYLYKSVLGYPSEVIRNLVVSQKSNNVASWYASNEKRIHSTIESTIKTLEEMQ